MLIGTNAGGIRQAAETENNFTSVERINEMATQTPLEKYYDMPENEPPTDWPSEGRISFKNVTLKYRPELDPALRNLCFECHSHERIGIVGRTGSGKSSMLVSLFRMVELSEGTIRIDGVDISEIGLHDLRSRMAIVPQDPVLFNGTIRSNLDPTGLYNVPSACFAIVLYRRTLTTQSTCTLFAHINGETGNSIWPRVLRISSDGARSLPVGTEQAKRSNIQI